MSDKDNRLISEAAPGPGYAGHANAAGHIYVVLVGYDPENTNEPWHYVSANAVSKTLPGAQKYVANTLKKWFDQDPMMQDDVDHDVRAYIEGKKVAAVNKEVFFNSFHCLRIEEVPIV